MLRCLSQERKPLIDLGNVARDAPLLSSCHSEKQRQESLVGIAVLETWEIPDFLTRKPPTKQMARRLLCPRGAFS